MTWKFILYWRCLNASCARSSRNFYFSMLSYQDVFGHSLMQIFSKLWRKKKVTYLHSHHSCFPPSVMVPRACLTAEKQRCQELVCIFRKALPKSADDPVLSGYVPDGTNDCRLFPKAFSLVSFMKTLLFWQPYFWWGSNSSYLPGSYRWCIGKCAFLQLAHWWHLIPGLSWYETRKPPPQQALQREIGYCIS